MHVGKGIKWMEVGRPPFVKKTWGSSNEEGVSIYMAGFNYIPFIQLKL